MMPTPHVRVPPGPAAISAHDLDIAGLVRRCGGEVDLAQMILLEFTRAHDELLQRIDAALGHADGRAVEQALHTIAGVAGNVGAARVSSEAIRLRRRVEQEGLASVVAAVDALRTEFAALPALAHRAAEQLMPDTF